MAHCPQCGTACPDSVAKCPSCGLQLSLVRGARGAASPASRTILGGVGPGFASAAPFPSGPLASGAPGGDLSDTIRMEPSELPGPEPGLSAAPIPAPRSGSSPSARTMRVIAPPAIARAQAGAHVASTQVAGTPALGAFSADHAALAPVAPAPSQSTLLGVARPGIAPLRPGVQKTPVEDEDPPHYEPAQELGATYYRRDSPKLPPPERIDVLAQRDMLGRRLDRGMRVHPAVQKMPAPKPVSKRGLYVILAAAGLAVFAVAFAFLWPSAPPLSVQVRAAEGGAEVLDVRCPSCPEGTLLKLGEAEAMVKDKKATLPLSTPLAIGDTPLKIHVDRPGSGRDETVGVTARIAYRIRPDLAMLDADSPSIQIVVEAMKGSKVSLDGEDIPMRDGRAIRTIDVSKDLEGSSASSDTLARKVSYAVTPPDGAEEKGIVAVNATVLPLVVDAPGPAIVTDQSTFVLAGKTLPGAEIAVAGRPLDVSADGSFNRTMNVSSVGATQIEVRAKMHGKAPRFTKISVERVASLDAAATEFNAKSPIGYAELAKDATAAKGKLVALEGEVAEVRPGAASTLVVLHAKGCPADKPCPVRLSLGFRLSLKREDKIKVFGTVAGVVEDGSSSIPSVDVAFALAPDAKTDPHGKSSQVTF